MTEEEMKSIIDSAKTHAEKGDLKSLEFLFAKYMFLHAEANINKIRPEEWIFSYNPARKKFDEYIASDDYKVMRAGYFVIDRKLDKKGFTELLVGYKMDFISQENPEYLILKKFTLEKHLRAKLIAWLKEKNIEVEYEEKIIKPKIAYLEKEQLLINHVIWRMCNNNAADFYEAAMLDCISSGKSLTIKLSSEEKQKLEEIAWVNLEDCINNPKDEVVYIDDSKSDISIALYNEAKRFVEVSDFASLQYMLDKNFKLYFHDFGIWRDYKGKYQEFIKSESYQLAMAKNYILNRFALHNIDKLLAGNKTRVDRYINIELDVSGFNNWLEIELNENSRAALRQWLDEKYPGIKYATKSTTKPNTIVKGAEYLEWMKQFENMGK